MAKDTVCLGCSKKFNKSESSLQCTVCGLWIHKSCSGVTDEVFELIEKQLKTAGITYWACRPCTVYAQGMNHRMRDIEVKVGVVEKGVEENREGVKKLDKKVDGIREELKKRDDKVEKAVREAEKRMEAEWREREAKRFNVIFHCIGEAEDRRATGSERQEWDRKSCVNIFRALKLNIGEDAIRFCRRVGEKKEEPRLMVVGFWAEGDKCLLLRNARNLERTIFKEVTVGPDLTKKQRAEEAEMKEEADRRNREELTEEDVSKNLKWAVVGDRGKKSLIKTVTREREGERGAGWRRREDQGGQPRTLQKKGPGGAVVGGRNQRREERVSETRRKRLTPEKTTEKGQEKEKTTDTESERESSSESEAESGTEVEQMETAEEEEQVQKPQEKKKGRKRKTRSPGARREGPPVKK